MFAITGSEKRCDKGAPLFTVRVDGVVGRYIAYTRIQTQFRAGKRKKG